jgi:hypothetical protein
MDVCMDFPLVDDVLEQFSTELGGDRAGYRNHVYRVINYCRALTQEPIPDTLLIAASFHDLGIWTDATFDYLEPSARRALNYLASVGMEKYADEIRTVIRFHHQITRYRGEFAAPVETLRRADRMDLSWGVLSAGTSRAFIRDVKRAFPNAGFHCRLFQLAGRQCLKTPLAPLPMLRW